MFVGTIPLLGQSWGERGESIGSKTKLFEKVLSQEFRNSILLKSIVPAESRLGGLLPNSWESRLKSFVSERTLDPSPTCLWGATPTKSLPGACGVFLSSECDN